MLKMTREEKLKMVEEWKTSGKTIAEWCKEHHIHKNTFFGWTKYSRQSSLDRKNFIELRSNKKRSTPAIEIRCQGVCIIIRKITGEE